MKKMLMMFSLILLSPLMACPACPPPPVNGEGEGEGEGEVVIGEGEGEGEGEAPNDAGVIVAIDAGIVVVVDAGVVVTVDAGIVSPPVDAGTVTPPPADAGQCVGGPPFDPAGARNVGNGHGMQFIGGQCLNSRDCASGCCAKPNGICSGQGAQFQNGKCGCGFGD